MSDISGENPVDDGTTAAAGEQLFVFSFEVGSTTLAASKERKQELAAIRARHHEDNQARRTRVLTHKDLREAMERQPIGYSDASRWNGYVPPRTDPELACGRRCGLGGLPCRNEHMTPANTSLRRRALIEVGAEALRREKAA